MTKYGMILDFISELHIHRNCKGYVFFKYKKKKKVIG